MEYIASFEAAKKWGVSVRVVQEYCSAGRVAGARRYARAWMIPDAASKPLDPRKVKEQSPVKPVLPYGVPNFLLSKFYGEAGSADALAEKLDSGEARTLLKALLAYYRGEDSQARQMAEELLLNQCSFETRIGASLTLAMCALYSGSAQNWNRAKAQLYALEQARPDSAAVKITGAALNGVLCVSEAPLWLQKGRFSDFPQTSYPSVFYLYAKWLLTSKRYESLIAAVEPMIAAADCLGCVLSGAYLHMIAGAAYRVTGDGPLAREHMEAALKLTLPDGLYGVLAEYRRQLGTALDDALKEKDPRAFKHVRETYDRLANGFTLLRNAVTGGEVSNELTLREHEIVTLAISGHSNASIARHIGVTVGSVKMYFNAIYQKLGVSGRDELGKFVV